MTNQDILLVPLEALRLAEGHSIKTTDADGNEYTVRLPTEDEAIQMMEKARAALRAQGIEIAECTEQDIKAARLSVKPVNVVRMN